MKKSLIVAGLLSVGTSLMAQNENFIGVGFGNGSLTVDVNLVRQSDGATGSASVNDNGGIASIIGGTIIDKKHKLSLGYTAYNTAADVDMTSIDLGYVFFIDQDSFNISNKKWKPFVGVGYSMISYTEQLSSSYSKSESTIDINAMTMELGIDYEIDKKQFLTMQYGVPLSGTGNDTLVYTSGGTAYDATLELNNVSRWILSYNYKF